MDLGLLLLRLVIGGLLVGHGAQKLFGAFGGHGLEGTGGFFALRRMTKRSSVSTSTSRPADMWRRSESTSSGESAGISGITSALMVSAAMIREATSQCRTRLRGW